MTSKNNCKGGIIIKKEQTTKKGKIIKTLTLPQLIAKKLEQKAKITGCKQADLVNVAICELEKLNDDELTNLLIQYQIY